MKQGDRVTPLLKESFYYGLEGIVHQTNKHGAFVFFPDRLFKSIVAFFPFKELTTYTGKMK